MANWTEAGAERDAGDRAERKGDGSRERSAQAEILGELVRDRCACGCDAESALVRFRRYLASTKAGKMKCPLFEDSGDRSFDRYSSHWRWKSRRLKSHICVTEGQLCFTIGREPEGRLFRCFPIGCGWKGCRVCGGAYAARRRSGVESLLGVVRTANNEVVEDSGRGVMVTLTYPHGKRSRLWAYRGASLKVKRFFRILRDSAPDLFSGRPMLWALEPHLCGHPHVHAVIDLERKYLEEAEPYLRSAWWRTLHPKAKTTPATTRSIETTAPAGDKLARYVAKHFGRGQWTWPEGIAAYLCASGIRTWNTTHGVIKRKRTRESGWSWEMVPSDLVKLRLREMKRTGWEDAADYAADAPF